MKLVVLSGGSGKRLWPLSNEVRSKQFLKMLTDSDNQLISMVQRIWMQLEESQLREDALISTCKTQLNLIQSHLGIDAPIVIEPERRDTFPAIALAASYLYSKKNTGLDEVITVLPVDPYVQQHFFTKLKQLEQVLHDSQSDLALIGVKPTYASTKYGYIVPCIEDVKNDSSNGYVRVGSFEEKPSEERAQRLIEQGAIWNCGVFAFRLGFLIDKLKQKNIPVQYDELLQQYGNLPKISFDYEVVEKTNRIAAIPYEGDWKDLGSWDVLTEELPTHLVGKGYIGMDCANTHVINELDIPVIVFGMSNSIVAASPNGILVSNKTKSHHVKEIVQDIDHKPRFEEYPWGWCKILDGSGTEGRTSRLALKICIFAGNEVAFPPHFNKFVTWMVESGEGEAKLEGKTLKLQAGEVMQIPSGTHLKVKVKSELNLVEVRIGGENNGVLE